MNIIKKSADVRINWQEKMYLAECYVKMHTTKQYIEYDPIINKDCG